MSMKEFVDYYESTHSKIGEKYLRGNAVKYIRRYLTPMPNPFSGEIQESEYDAVMEMWFQDQDQFRTAMAGFLVPEVADLVRKDEEQLFERSQIRLFTVEERESDVSGGHK